MLELRQIACIPGREGGIARDDPVGISTAGSNEGWVRRRTRCAKAERLPHRCYVSRQGVSKTNPLVVWKRHCPVLTLAFEVRHTVNPGSERHRLLVPPRYPALRSWVDTRI